MRKTVTKKIAVLILLFIVLVSSIHSLPVFAEGTQNVYYVSSSNGSDSNDGLTENTAWKTLDKVNATTFIPGSVIKFKAGDSWRGSLIPSSGTAGSSVTYTRYGEGCSPIIYGSVEANVASAWTPVKENVWSFASPNSEKDIPAINSYDFEKGITDWHCYGNFYIDMDKTTGYNSSNSLKIVTGANTGNTSIDLQVWKTPTALKKNTTYELRFKAKSSRTFSLTTGGVFIMQNSSPYSDYTLEKHGDFTPSFTTDWKEYKMFFTTNENASTDARIEFKLGGPGNMPANTTLNLDNVTLNEYNDPFGYRDIGNIVLNNGQNFGMKKSSESNLSTEGDFYSDTANERVLLYSVTNPANTYNDIELCISKDIINESNKSYVTYNGLKLLYGGGHGIAGGNTSNITVLGCEIGYIGGGYLQGNERYGNGVEFWESSHDDLVANNHIYQIYDAAVTNQSASENKQENNIVYSGNMIENSEYSYEFWMKSASSTMENIRFEKNSCFSAGSGWGHSQRPNPTGRHICVYTNPCTKNGITIRYNNFVNAADSCLFFSNMGDFQGISLDQNNYIQDSGKTLIEDYGLSYKVTIDLFADYITKMTQDMNSRFNGKTYTP